MSELLTVAQVAQLLQVAPDTVMRRFAKVKGVLDIGTAETPKRRRYRVLRIPRTVVEKWAIQHGGRITVDIPPPALPAPKAKSGNPKPQTPQEDAIRAITRDLDTVTGQHGDAARRTLGRIASRAKTLTFVPQDQWQDIVWLDGEEED
jgi:hypothetical protein